MDFELSEDQQTIRAAVAELAGKFDDHYWMTKDQRHEFPTEFYDTFAEGGWLGITTPEEYGGRGSASPKPPSCWRRSRPAAPG